MAKPATPEAFFAPYPKALPLYRAVREAIEKLGDVEVRTHKTQITFRAERGFAYLWIPAMSLQRGPPDLYLTFDLARRVRSARIKQSVEPRPGLWTHHMLLARKSDLDAEVRGWLREAYETRGLKPKRAT